MPKSFSRNHFTPKQTEHKVKIFVPIIISLAWILNSWGFSHISTHGKKNPICVKRNKEWELVLDMKL